MKKFTYKYAFLLLMILSVFISPLVIETSAASDSTGMWGEDISWTFESSTGTLTFTGYGEIPGNDEFFSELTRFEGTDEGEAIETVVFEETVIAPENSSYLFSNLTNLKTIEGLDNIDTSYVTNMDSMFLNCIQLTNIDGMEDWSVENVRDMSYLFASCETLTNLDALASWETYSLEYLYGTFAGMDNLSTIDGLENWAVSMVINMGVTFSGCESLRNVDALASWYMPDIEVMQTTFYGCTNLSNIDGLASWDVSNAFEMTMMFSECSSLQNLDALTNWRLGPGIDISAIFENCTNLVDASGIANWGVTSGYYRATTLSVFSGCSNLEKVNLSSWNTRGVIEQDMEDFFGGCTKLQSITLGSDTVFYPTVNLPAIDTTSGQYTGEWIGINTENIYADSDTFISTYDGSIPDTYVWRETPTYDVTYTFVSGTKDMELPTQITSLLPVVETGKIEATIVTPPTLTSTTIPVTDGTWTFEGWDQDSVTIVNADVMITGTWVYTPNTPPTEKTVDLPTDTTPSGMSTRSVSNISTSDPMNILELSIMLLGSTVILSGLHRMKKRQH